MPSRSPTLYAVSLVEDDIAEAPTPNVLESAIENSHDCIALVDMTGNITYMNFSGACQMGLDNEAYLKRMRWSQLWSRDCVDLTEYSLESVRAGRACRIAVHRPGPLGAKKFFDVAASAVFDSTGTPSHMLCVCRDVTDLRLTECDAVAIREKDRSPAQQPRSQHFRTE